MVHAASGFSFAVYVFVSSKSESACGFDEGIGPDVALRKLCVAVLVCFATLRMLLRYVACVHALCAVCVSLSRKCVYLVWVWTCATRKRGHVSIFS